MNALKNVSMINLQIVLWYTVLIFKSSKKIMHKYSQRNNQECGTKQRIRHGSLEKSIAKSRNKFYIPN